MWIGPEKRSRRRVSSSCLSPSCIKTCIIACKYGLLFMLHHTAMLVSQQMGRPMPLRSTSSTRQLTTSFASCKQRQALMFTLPRRRYIHTHGTNGSLNGACRAYQPCGTPQYLHNICIQWRRGFVKRHKTHMSLSQRGLPAAEVRPFGCRSVFLQRPCVTPWLF